MTPLAPMRRGRCRVRSMSKVVTLVAVIVLLALGAVGVGILLRPSPSDGEAAATTDGAPAPTAPPGAGGTGALPHGLTRREVSPPPTRIAPGLTPVERLPGETPERHSIRATYLAQLERFFREAQLGPEEQEAMVRILAEAGQQLELALERMTSPEEVAAASSRALDSAAREAEARLEALLSAEQMGVFRDLGYSVTDLILADVTEPAPGPR